jgi:hypothetical protein
MTHLGVEVAAPNLGSEFDFFNGDMSRLLACFARSLRLFIPKLAVVHDAADRWVGKRCDFNEVKVNLSSEGQGVGDGLDT